MPRLAVRVTSRAVREIRRALQWWATNRRDAPDAVGEELERTFELLAAQPEIGARAVNQRLGGVRRFYLGRIQYYVFYRVAPAADEIHILCVWHAKRGSGPRL